MNAHVLAGVWVHCGRMEPRGLARLTGRKDLNKKKKGPAFLQCHLRLHRGNLSTRISTEGLGSGWFLFSSTYFVLLAWFTHTQPKLVNLPHAHKTDYSQICLISEILLLKLFHLKLFGESSTEIRSTTTSKDTHSTEGGSRSRGRNPSVECGTSTLRPRYRETDRDNMTWEKL